MANNILNKYNEGLVFYGSYAHGYYSNSGGFEGIVYTVSEFNSLVDKAPHLLPDTNACFYELDGEHSEVEGEEFVKRFNNLAEYYLWYNENNVDVDCPTENLLDDCGASVADIKTSLTTCDDLHKVLNWGKRDESVFSLINKEYEVVSVLAKKEAI